MTSALPRDGTLPLMTDDSLLTPLLADSASETDDASEYSKLRRALAADPALVGRVSCDDSGVVVLTGPTGGTPPASKKERERWELHVRLRLAAELGQAAASTTTLRWAEQPSP